MTSRNRKIEFIINCLNESADCLVDIIFVGKATHKKLSEYGGWLLSKGFFLGLLGKFIRLV